VLRLSGITQPWSTFVWQSHWFKAFLILAGSSGILSAADESNQLIVSKEQLAVSLEQAWETSWTRFYRSDTHLFYDYLTSYEDGKWLKHLPTAEEVKRQYPNECEYGTGMEDCMISAGVMLSLIVDRFLVTGEESLHEGAYEVFQGIQLCATAHGSAGFLARAVCHEDLKSIYFNSSRDQYTHAVHGLWQYARSPLCNAGIRKEIGTVVGGIADRMIRNVVPENDYDSLRADGTRDTRGISRMWNVNGHEAARLPMIYAAAWDVTGKRAYYQLWRKYVADAVRQSFDVEGWQPTYAFLQMQMSLELLAEMEPDPQLRKQMKQVMATVAQRCAVRADSAYERGTLLDLTEVCTDWRTGEGISFESGYRKIWYCIRESGEAALAQLAADQMFPDEQEELLKRSILRLDYDKVSSNGILFLQAAWWKHCARQLGADD